MNEKKMINIIVGCGGSGAKIAVGMAELMGQDPAWRYDMDEHVYFMLLDTDRGDLEDHSRRLENAAPDIHVSTMLTTQGYQNVGQILDVLGRGVDTGDKVTARKALERFAERWWVTEKTATNLNDAKPFRAPGVNQITRGAAQVPMVSYLATWIAMKPGPHSQHSIENSINNLCATIAARVAGLNYGGENPLGEFNIFFVGSLAGGTGRGSLIPVAFKMKEVFYDRFGRIPFISAYLMDQSCFEQVRMPHEELPQMMNAMTGWSEISSWLSYYQKEGSGLGEQSNYGYSLPGHSNMHDRANDVLRSLLEDERIGRAGRGHHYGLDRARLPFDAVGVIGRQSAAGFEANDVENLYQMTSTSLYLRLTQSKIDTRISNEGRTYFSVGSAVAMIPYQEIEAFFNDKATFDACRRFTAETPQAEVAADADAALDLLGLANPIADFLNFDPLQEVRTPMQAFAKHCREEMGGWFTGQLSGVAAAMDDQDPQEAERLLDELLGESQLEDDRFLADAAAHYVDQYLSYGNRTKGEKALRNEDEMVEAVVEHALGAMERGGSARAVEQVCLAAAARLRELRDGVLSRNGVEQWLGATDSVPNSSADILRKAKSREGLFGIVGPHYSEDEKAEVQSAAKAELAVLTLRALGKAFSLPPRTGVKGVGLLQRVISRLEDAAARAKFLCRSASHVGQRLNINVETLEDLRKKLFSGDDPTRAIADGADIHIRRKVLPIFPADEELLLQAGAADGFAKAVIRGRDDKGAVYEAPGKEDPVDRPDWLESLEKGFKEAKYRANSVDGPRELMSKFRLIEVLRDIAKAWRKKLQEAWTRGNKDYYHKHAQRFRNFFGIQPKVVGDIVEINGGDEFQAVAGNDSLILGLATAAVRTCRPFWRTQDGAESSPHLIVQVPVSIEEANRGQWKEFIQKHSNMPLLRSDRVDLVANATAGNENEHNPYVLVAYCSTAAEGLDQVTTLDAWNGNPTLLEALRLAEDIEGECPMPFNRRINEIWPEYRGSGFSDPSYVYRPELRRNRWRPWLTEEMLAQQTKGDADGFSVLVTVYACLGPKWFLEAALGGAEAAQVLETTEVPAEPILSEGVRKLFSLGRPPVRIAAGKASPTDRDVLIVPGNVVGQSIRTLPDILAGQRKPRTGADVLTALGKAAEEEYNAFFQTLADAHNFHEKSARANHLKMLERLKDHAIAERDAIRAAAQDENDRDFWQKVVEAVAARITEVRG